jgi:hypothetical protein
MPSTAPSNRRTTSGRITHKGYEHMTIDITAECMEHERLSPGAGTPALASRARASRTNPRRSWCSSSQEIPEGTLLTVVELGFDQIPLARRAKASRENEEGWTWLLYDDTQMTRPAPQSGPLRMRGSGAVPG